MNPFSEIKNWINVRTNIGSTTFWNRRICMYYKNSVFEKDKVWYILNKRLQKELQELYWTGKICFSAPLRILWHFGEEQIPDDDAPMKLNLKITSKIAVVVVSYIQRFSYIICALISSLEWDCFLVGAFGPWFRRKWFTETKYFDIFCIVQKEIFETYG